jgi:hypothetical protein
MAANAPMPPATPAATPAPGRLTARVFLAFATLFVVVLAAGSAALWYRYDQTLAVAQRRADNLDLILTEHFRRSVDAIDATLTQLALYNQRLPAGQPPAEAWSSLLAAALSGLPGVGSISVIDASGTITASTIPMIVGQSRADYFVFRHLSSHPDSGLVADEPFTSVRDGRILLPLGRPLRAPDGSFAGIIVATLEPDRLRGFYESVGVGQRGVISVLHPTGAILFREPSLSDPIGKMAEDTPLLRAQRLRPERGMVEGPLMPAAQPI